MVVLALKKKSSYKIGEEFEKKCVAWIEQNGFTAWRPKKSRQFRKGEKGGTDVFGLFDVIAVRKTPPFDLWFLQCKKNKASITKKLRAKIKSFRFPDGVASGFLFEENGKIKVF